MPREKTPEAIVKECIRRLKAAKSVRSGWEATWQELIDYFVPNKRNIVSGATEGEKKTSLLYDSTSLDCVARLSASMQGNLTPSATKWFYLKFRNDDLNDIQEVREWLEDCAKRMRLAYNQSNLSTCLTELYVDLIVFGTGCLLQEETPPRKDKFQGLRFKAYSVGTFYVEEDHEERVSAVFREFSLPAREAKKKWGDDAKKSQKIVGALRNNPETKFSFLHAVYPRDVYSEDENAPSSRWPYASVYICLDDNTLIRNGGYNEFPCAGPRWSRASDETYGRGLGHLALPDVKTLNRVKELNLKALALEVNPPIMQLSNGVTGPVRLKPGGRTIVNEKDALVPFDQRVKHDATRFNIEMLVQAIRAELLVDQLILKDSPQMTAEEVRARLELMQRVLGPTFGRLEAELLGPLVSRSFAIMARAKALPPLPAAVRDAYAEGAAEIDIEYEGPLARAQRDIEAQAIDEMYAAAIPIAEAGVTEAFDIIDHEKAARHRAAIRGVPASVLRTTKQVRELQEARKATEEELMKKAAGGQDAQTAKVMAEAAVKMNEMPQGEEEAMAGAQ